MYFCKNCGEPYMTDEAVMCVKCGVAKGQGNNYCHNCGKPLAPDAASPRCHGQLLVLLKIYKIQIWQKRSFLQLPIFNKSAIASSIAFFVS